MLKFWYRLLPLIICLGTLAGLPRIIAAALTEPDVATLVQRNIEARGGRERILSVQALKIRGINKTPRFQAPFTLVIKRPGRIRLELDLFGQKILQAFDGQDTWWIMPFSGSTSPQPMPEPAGGSFRESANIEGALLDYETKGHRLEFRGTQQLDGVPTYKLTLFRNDGTTMDIYLDAETFLETRHSSRQLIKGQETDISTTFSDYRAVDGYMVAYKVEVTAANRTEAIQTLIVEGVEINPEVSDEIFARPVSPAGDRVVPTPQP